MKQKYPDYLNCITNLANSILAEFGAAGEEIYIRLLE